MAHSQPLWRFSRKIICYYNFATDFDIFFMILSNDNGGPNAICLLFINIPSEIPPFQENLSIRCVDTAKNNLLAKFCTGPFSPFVDHVLSRAPAIDESGDSDFTTSSRNRFFLVDPSSLTMSVYDGGSRVSKEVQS